MQKYENYEYIGEFKNDMRHGQMGKCFFFNGDFYAGPWKDDMMDTYETVGSAGILIRKDGMLRYFGGFKAGQMQGWGVLYEEKVSGISSEYGAAGQNEMEVNSGPDLGEEEGTQV